MRYQRSLYALATRLAQYVAAVHAYNPYVADAYNEARAVLAAWPETHAERA